MEALGGYHSRASGSSSSRARVVSVLLSAALSLSSLYLLYSRLGSPSRRSDFYTHSVLDARGRSVSLHKYRGKISLVVNVASQSEVTEQNYRALQELHRELGPAHFNVLAFPCAQYGHAEPGSGRDAEAFARSNYGVTFPIFNKIKIMGSEAEPAFKFLTDSVQRIPKSNFWKFLVNAEGQVVKFWKAEESMEDVRQEVMAHVRNIILKKRQEL